MTPLLSARALEELLGGGNAHGERFLMTPRRCAGLLRAGVGPRGFEGADAAPRRHDASDGNVGMMVERGSWIDERP